MKRNNKKGFTIVELVIVIAVIAILSAVLIPTFAGVTKKAKQSAALQNATQAVTAIISEDLADADETNDVGGNFVIKSGDYYFAVANYQINTTPVADFDEDAYDTVDVSAIEDMPTGIDIFVAKPANNG